MKNTKRRRYSETFKKEAVMRVMERNSSTYNVSRQLGISQSMLSKWVRNFKEKGVSGFAQEDAEMKQLRAKVKRLQDERDILKKAVTFFAKHDG